MAEMTADETGSPVCDDTTSALLSGGGTAIPLFKVHMPPSVLEPLNATLMSGYIGQGPKVDEFESALAPWFGNDNVLSVNAGTSALHLALRLADVGAGDDVVTTPMTCSATNEPILERGARVVWADINPLTGNIDPLDVERKITSSTKAIMAVHWGGYPCDFDELNRIARKYNVALIEDAAHAFGATY
jgi:dTDP-4-amino-4,6-dideoxygalactose transaminase